MKKTLKRLCLLTALLFALCSMTGCVSLLLGMAEGIVEELAGTEATPAPAPSVNESAILPGRGAEFSEIRYSASRYTRPDFPHLADIVEQAALLIEGDDADALFAAYDEAADLYSAALTQYALLNLAFDMDVTDEAVSEELAAVGELVNSAQIAMLALSTEILDSRHAAEAEARWGKERIAELRLEESLASPEIEEPLAREQELIMEYQQKVTGFAAEINGRTYTLEDIYADEELDYDGYIAYLGAYYAALAEEVGPIFLEMLTLRNEIAHTMGYENYSDYSYACYSRDFAPEDASRLHAVVKKYAVPLYLRMNLDEDFTDSEEFIYYYYGEYPVEDALAAFERAAEQFSPKLSESFDFLLEKELYYLGNDPNCTEGGFTTYFEAYRSPFLYAKWTDGSYDVGTLIHEMGHFTNYYYLEEPLFGSVDSLDLAEIDSQGLEMMLFPMYEEFYGEYADAARRDKLSDFLYAVISGCMEDEFQQYIYNDPNMTLEEMHALYGRLMKEYGISELYLVPEEYWVCVPHTFQSPMYYISYATSALPALEMWELSLEDYDAARDTYWQLIERSPMASFREELASLGLSDPFDSDLVERICIAIEEAVYGIGELSAAA